ncbi:tetratricopeptide repeat protein, partial [Glycocaulis sp.]|uniref:tetratricopeptide repeat protein n=1 Tax=Glycocaulis sp. TaxID=1969725 RepID=UPI003F71D4CB
MSVTLQTIFAAYTARNYAAAQGMMNSYRAANPETAQSAHLQGLISRRLGDIDGALGWMRHSLRLDPGNHEYLNNYAGCLLAAGRSAEAADAWKQAAKARPAEAVYAEGLVSALSASGDHQAAERAARALTAGSGASRSNSWVAAAKAYYAAGMYLEAISAFEKAADLGGDPASCLAGRIDALALMDRTDELAAMLDEQPASLRGHVSVQSACARATFLAGKPSDAVRMFQDIWSRQATISTFRDLAQALWTAGKTEEFEALIESVARTGDPAFVAVAADCLYQIDRHADALALLARLPEASLANPQIAGLRAIVLQGMGEGEQSLELARIDYAARPHDSGCAINLVVSLLMTGAYGEADELISKFRSRYPLDQGWLAYQATLWRLTDNPQYRKLYDYERFVRAYHLPGCDGYPDGESLNSALKSVLEARHVLARSPFNQSLRNGIQTPRSLLCDPSPAVRAYLSALRGPISQYLNEIGRDKNHELTCRNTGKFRLSGCWSVRLYGGGRHVNHFHPAGWI